MMKRTAGFLMAAVIMWGYFWLDVTPVQAAIMPLSEGEVAAYYEAFTEQEILNLLVSAGAVYNQRFDQTMNPFVQPEVIYNLKKESRRTALAGPAWGINNKEDLEKTLDWILAQGHNDPFMEVAVLLSELSAEEYGLLLSLSNDMGKQVLPMVKTIYDEYGNSGILAWDMYRAALLVMWGYEAHYLTKEECVEWGRPIAMILKGTFESWDSANRNYLLGYCFWANTTTADSEYLLRVQAKEKVMQEKPQYFDNTFFLQHVPQ